MALLAALQEAITFVKSIHDDICEHVNIVAAEEVPGLAEPADDGNLST